MASTSTAHDPWGNALQVSRIVLDGTGTNAERQRRRMRAAREAGWFVKILYVDLPLETAVRRAAQRERPVKASKIYLVALVQR